MEDIQQQSHKDLERLKSQFWSGFMLWTMMIGALLAWSLNSVDDEVLRLARQEAISNFNKDQAFRAWSTQHGGVYVYQSELTPENSWLSHIPDRFIDTPQGRRLVLLSPALMLRQMMDEYSELYGVKGRITSIHPLNPDNAPDEWEKAALLAFEKGEAERFEISTIEGEPFLRLIRPMETVAGCLKCHGHQGYKVGDVRGGVGVSVPLKRYYAISSDRKLNLWFAFLLVWVIGLILFRIINIRGKQRVYERLEFQGHIWKQANFDSLTQLSNRDLFHDRMSREISHSKREKMQLALLYIDLDRFKTVNDARGHATGDQLLQEVASRLQLCVRDVDTVSRLGGDEFAIILPSIMEKESVVVVVRKLLDLLSQPFSLDGYMAHISASIGIAIYPDDGNDSQRLLQNADTAMYKAKAEGKNTYRYFSNEMNTQIEEQIVLEAALYQAIEEEQFELYYQPIFDYENKLKAAEALIRWNSPSLGVVYPDQFIPLAEQTGMVIQMGDWVMRQAASDLSSWDRAGLHLKSLAVNVSPVQFRMADFTRNVLNLIEKNPHLHSRLTLELTESVFIDEQSNPGEHLHQLRQKGVHISMDDFGTGYSSLSYLKRFPVDKLKIDRSFIRDIISDPDDAALCEAIISMGSHLNLEVIAEGVETEAQWKFLSDCGCDYAQGYLRGRPMPTDEFSVFMRAHL